MQRYKCSKHNRYMVPGSITDSKGTVTQIFECPVPGCEKMKPNKWQRTAIHRKKANRLRGIMTGNAYQDANHVKLFGKGPVQ